ncbi:MAG: DUF5722 domain-containing protein, partial [Planctomycetota bacterium]
MFLGCFATVLSVSLFSETVGGSQSVGRPRVTQVSATDAQIRIEVSAPETNGTWNLVEFPVWTAKDEKPAIIWTQAFEANPDASATVAVPRFVGGGTPDRRDRLFSRWSVIKDERTEASFETRYVDVVMDVEKIGHPELRSKKGLGGFASHRGHLDDLDTLGIDTVTVNLPLRFFRTTPGPDREKVVESGYTFYIDKRVLQRFDATLRFAAERDALVFGILLVGVNRDQPASTQPLVHPDYDPAGVFAMPDLTTPKGVAAYAAAVKTLAERYCRSDGQFGRIHHWIVHNEADAGWQWTNAGTKKLPDYVDLYYRSMRITHLIGRSYDPESKVLVSLTHSWKKPAIPRGYSTRRFLELLVSKSRSQGNFDWAVAYHPYPSSLRNPATWSDHDALFSNETPKVTFRNLEVLCEWARRTENLYEGKTRDLYLTEQGFNSPSYSEDDLQRQAAGLAYAWKKISALPEIKAMHYHNWMDNRHEGGLRIGLRRFPDDDVHPSGPKPAWHLYKALGTASEAEACE